ncbi:unnamed protein product [Sphagnum balticum]
MSRKHHNSDTFSESSHVLINYDGIEAESIYSRSLSRWQTALRLAKSMPRFPESSFKLQGLLSRTPSLPNDIPTSSARIEGYSTWKNCDAKCPIAHKIERANNFRLRSRFPVECTISPSNNFQFWEGKSNNGIALLVLGWAYILSASLAERQQLPLHYVLPDGPSGSVEIHLSYASSEELIWWKAIVARGVGWTIGGEFSPWAVQVNNLDLEIAGNIDVIDTPPTAIQAASYLARLCNAFDLGNQYSAALAAALSLPLHRSTSLQKPAAIELPCPLLSTCTGSPGQCQNLIDFKLLGRYMALSLDPNYFGSAMWSIFWEPDVPCNFAGAWLGPINNVLRPIILDNKLELLAKVLSFTNVAPLWLGVALCGRTTIINSILPFLDELRPYPYVRPFANVAAWTGIPQSFMDKYPSGPYLQNGRISRANVWRLRHDCYEKYEDGSFSTTPLCGWPPFGEMRDKDVEFELLDHLNCSHQWKYEFWTWLPSGIRDTGFLDEGRDSRLPHKLFHRKRIQENKTQDAKVKTQDSKISYKASLAATRKVFEWCSSQVEKGFGGSVVLRHTSDALLGSAESDITIDLDAIEKWIQSLE